jgi:predicted amidohydrolase YtcJ
MDRLVASCLSPGTSQAATADRIGSGGTILTVNDAAPRAGAVAEQGGRIIAIGSEAEVMAHRGASTRVIDLAGRTLFWGDSHAEHTVGPCWPPTSRRPACSASAG